MTLRWKKILILHKMVNDIDDATLTIFSLSKQPADTIAEKVKKVTQIYRSMMKDISNYSYIY